MRTINIANQKGGVGKTTTVINLAWGLALWEKRVLVVDFDPQGNTTTGLGISKRGLYNNVYTVLSGRVPIREAIMSVTNNEYLSCLPANEDLSAFPLEAAGEKDRLFILDGALKAVRAEYDFIIIDSPPSLNLITLNAMTASSDILIPVQSEFYALEGLSQLLRTKERIEEAIAKKINILGFLITMYDSRTTMARQVEEELKKHFAGKVLRTIIPRNVRIAEAPGFGESVLTYDPSSRGAFAYKELVKELLERI